MSTNILEILGVAGKEDVITNLLKYAINESITFRVHFLQEICGLTGVHSDDEFKAETRILAGEAGIPDLVIWRKGNNQADLVILENKLKAEEGFEQTKRYETPACVQSLRNNPKLKIPLDAEARFIFLTLFDDQVSETQFVPKRYSDVLKILEKLTFDNNTVVDKLLEDLKTILQKFYAFGNVSAEDLLRGKLMQPSLQEGSYLYFKRMFSNSNGGFHPPNGLWLNGTFRSSAPGRRFFGAQFFKDGWNVKEMEKPLQGKWRLDSRQNMSIHFEPQYNLLNGAFTVPIHYEISPYDTEKWATENIDPTDYQAYRLIREYISLAVYSNITDCYTRGGGSNQIGKADINIDDNTTVAQFYHKFSNFLTEASTAIDIALKTVRGWTFDIRDLIISVDEIARQCKDKDYWLDPPKDGATEYGIYLKDNNGKNTLWVGIRCSHWHNHGDPISLAVHETNPSWSRKSLELFKLAYTDSQNFEEHSTYSFPLESNYGISVDGLMKTIDTHMAALAE